MDKPESFEIKFVSEEEASKSRVSRVSHRKSRNGCQRCRTRRVKCDEIRPICGNCRRIKLSCSFENDEVADSRHDPSSDPHIGVFDSIDLVKPLRDSLESSTTEETRTRRLLELKLMHAYTTVTSQSTFLPDDTTAGQVLIHEVPQLALENDGLLNCVFSFTALHLAELRPQEAASLMGVHQNYYAMALQEHARDVSCLNVNTYDAVCMTSTFIRLIAFVMLRNRQRSPYAPPVEWFRVIKGAMETFVVASQWDDANDDSVSIRLRNRMPFIFDSKAKFDAANREPFIHLLARIEGDDLENQTSDIRSTHERTVSYIGGIWLAMEELQQSSEILRRLILLPYLVDQSYLDLVKDRQPRALLILAYFFAMLSKFRHVWWVGATGEREVQGIASVLDGQWRSLLEWPLGIVNSAT